MSGFEMKIINLEDAKRLEGERGDFEGLCIMALESVLQGLRRNEGYARHLLILPPKRAANIVAEVLRADLTKVLKVYKEGDG